MRRFPDGVETLRFAVAGESRTLALTPTTTPPRLYQLFGVVDGNIVGSNARYALDDSRVVHER